MDRAGHVIRSHSVHLYFVYLRAHASTLTISPPIRR